MGVSPLSLASLVYVWPTSRLHLACISRMRLEMHHLANADPCGARPYLGRISAVSRPYLALQEGHRRLSVISALSTDDLGALYIYTGSRRFRRVISAQSRTGPRHTLRARCSATAAASHLFVW